MIPNHGYYGPRGSKISINVNRAKYNIGEYQATPMESHDATSNPFMLEKQMNKRHKKMMYKHAKDAILESPPSIYHMSNHDNHPAEHLIHGYDPHDKYYLPGHPIPYQHYYQPVYYNIHPSYMHYYKKYYHEEDLHRFAPLYGIPRVGT